MNKKLWIILSVVVLTLGLLFTQAYAAPPSARLSEKEGVTSTPNPKRTESNPRKEPQKLPEEKQKKVNLKGKVISFDGTSLVIDQKKGGQVSILVNADTTFKSKTEGAVPQPGDQVIVRAARQDDDSFTAIKVQIIPSAPSHLHRVGEVTAYSAGASMTVKNKKGETTTFQITADTVLLPAERADSLQVGSWVTIISPRDPGGSAVPVAKKIVIHPQK